MNVAELLSALLAEDPNAKVVILSGHQAGDMFLANEVRRFWVKLGEGGKPIDSWHSSISQSAPPEGPPDGFVLAVEIV